MSGGGGEGRREKEEVRGGGREGRREIEREEMRGERGRGGGRSRGRR